jgi:tRNA 2-thiouridine synthesizing protein A
VELYRAPGGAARNVRRFRPPETPGIVAAVARARLDLRGLKCPLSWARARVSLDVLAPGDEVDLVLDDARGARDVPRAAEAAGHHVVAVVEYDGTWTITLEV